MQVDHYLLIELLYMHLVKRAISDEIDCTFGTHCRILHGLQAAELQDLSTGCLWSVTLEAYCTLPGWLFFCML